MASATRGKYSQKEWDAMNKNKVAPVSVASKYTVPGSVESAASMVTSAQKDSSEAAYNASMIPIQLKADFKAKGDPKLDKAISEKQQQVFGGYTEGMSKYADIKDPFQRRALADKYQSGLATGLSALTSEKERRQGQINDYITKWAGTFGAEATRKQSEIAIAQDAFKMQKEIADSKVKASTKDFTYQEITQAVNQLKNSGKSWEDISSYLADKGVDVLKGSFADNQLRRAHGLDPVKAIDSSSSDRTPKQKYEDTQYSEINAMIEKAKNGQDGYYLDGKKVMRKVPGKFFGTNDELVYTIE